MTDEAAAAISAPLPAGTPRVLTEADAATTVAVLVGDTIAVTLIGIPTAGYVWEADSVPGFLSAAESLSGPTSEAQNQPGFTGGSHWETLTFRVNAPGNGRLTLVQHRPWESDEPPAQTYEVGIRAQ